MVCDGPGDQWAFHDAPRIGAIPVRSQSARVRRKSANHPIPAVVGQQSSGVSLQVSRTSIDYRKQPKATDQFDNYR